MSHGAIGELTPQRGLGYFPIAAKRPFENPIPPRWTTHLWKEAMVLILRRYVELSADCRGSDPYSLHGKLCLDAPFSSEV
jgi:hypothetical protein